MRLIPTLSILLALAAPALASDGVVEINQACATSSAGCFAGDAAGFPVTITQTGSYQLTSNLVSPIAVGAIEINAVNVTLDLGGFQVSSSNVCAGYPTTSCTVGFGTSGIKSSQYLVLVRNGVVVGMGGTGIDLAGASSAVEDVRVLGCGSRGISLGAAGRVFRSVSAGNNFYGIEVGDGGIAEGNESRANGASGIVAGGTLGGTAIENRVYSNGGSGIQLFGPGILSRNVIFGNSTAPTGLSGAFSLSDNTCNGIRC